MAKTPSSKRDYTFSDGTLLQLCDDISGSVTRDLTDLATYGVLAATVTALGVLRSNFTAVFGDGLKLGQVISATQTKNAAREALLTETRSLETRVASKLGPDSGGTRSLDIGSISQLTDRDLITMANNAHQAATLLLPDLVGTGVDAAYLTAYRAKISALDAAIDGIREAIKSRDLTTRDRVEKGNLLYTEIVRLAAFGKDKYYSTNEAKYNDYVIIENASALGNTRTGTLANNTKAHVEHAEIDGAESFKLTGDVALQYEVYFAATTTGDPTGPVTAVAAAAELTLTALQMGWEELKPFMMARNNAQGADVEYDIERL